MIAGGGVCAAAGATVPEGECRWTAASMKAPAGGALQEVSTAQSPSGRLKVAHNWCARRASDETELTRTSIMSCGSRGILFVAGAMPMRLLGRWGVPPTSLGDQIKGATPGISAVNR